MVDGGQRLAGHGHRRMARIHVRQDECKGCRFCVVICPKQVYEMTDLYNVRGYRVPEVRDEAACVACRRCETICPELAIYIEPKFAVASTAQAAGIEMAPFDTASTTPFDYAQDAVSAYSGC